VLIVAIVAFVGAFAEPNGEVFTHPTGAVHEVHVIVVVQQVEAVPQPALVL